MQLNYINDFNNRRSLIDTYGNNALLLYALEMRYEIPDIIAVANEALTDGGDDKKCDLIYIDSEMGIAVVAQAYMKQVVNEGDLASSNKASDLNTAAAWIFSREPEEVPERIRSQVAALQEAIAADQITNIYFWYVHNLNESNNPVVKDELSSTESNARAAVATLYPESHVEIHAIEVGNETLENWYMAANKQIVIEDTMVVDTQKKGFELSGDKWRAYVTAVSATWLKAQYDEFGDDLFSGNPRTFLGSGKKKYKINLGIIETMNDEPGNFWAYNNGLTALVNNYEIIESAEGEQELEITGLTIINGAQTTGAISAVNETEDAWVPIRFIVCKEPIIIENIITNNNKQNEILPSDMRSNDHIQNRLRADFEKYGHFVYSGGRRGAGKNTRNKDVLDHFMVAQSLLAFHGDCVTAYNSRKDLWDDDKLYYAIFTEQLSVEHIIFVYSLARSIDKYKLTLQNKGDMRTVNEQIQHEFLAKRGSKMLLIYAVSSCLESLLGYKISNSWGLKFSSNESLEDAVFLWEEVVKSILALAATLKEVVNDGLKSKELVEKKVSDLVGMITAIQSSLKDSVKDFVEEVKYNA